MGDRTFTCPVCGGTMEGDGWTVAYHCENTDYPMFIEPDADPIYCDSLNSVDDRELEIARHCAGIETPSSIRITDPTDFMGNPD